VGLSWVASWGIGEIVPITPDGSRRGGTRGHRFRRYEGIDAGDRFA